MVDAVAAVAAEVIVVVALVGVRVGWKWYRQLVGRAVMVVVVVVVVVVAGVGVVGWKWYRQLVGRVVVGR